MVEYKKDGVFTSKEEAFGVISDWYFSLAEKLDCPVICASDGVNTYWFHVKSKQPVKDEQDNDLRLVFDSAKIAAQTLTEEERSMLVELFEQFKNLNENGEIQKTSILNPKNLADRVWHQIHIE